MFSKKYFTTRKMVALAILAALATPLMFIEIAPVPIAPWLKFDFSDIVVLVTAVIYGPIGAIIVALIKSIINFFVKSSDVGIPLPQFIAFTSTLAYLLPFYFTMNAIKKASKGNMTSVKNVTKVLSVILTVVALISIEYLLVPPFTKLFNLAEPTNRLMWLVTYLGIVDLIIAILVMMPIMKKVDNENYFLIRLIPVTIGTIVLTVALTFLNYIWFTPWYLKLYGAPLPDPFFSYVVNAYAPFNFVKGIIISIVFVLLSYRLEQVSSEITGNETEHTLLDINFNEISYSSK